MKRKLSHIINVNKYGRDYVVGDIHGHFYMLEVLMAEVGFDPESDRVFALGDLIDRGPESERVSEFLQQKWFHSIRGNHEQMLSRGAYTVEQSPTDMDATRLWLENGGEWFFNMSMSDQEAIYGDVSQMPVMTEVGMPGHRRAGLIHADVIDDDWNFTCSKISPPAPDPDFAESLEHVLWSRDRYYFALSYLEVGGYPGIGVDGIDLVFFGHNPLREPCAIGNIRMLDTGAGQGRRLSLAELSPDGRVWSVGQDLDEITEGWRTA